MSNFAVFALTDPFIEYGELWCDIQSNQASRLTSTVVKHHRLKPEVKDVHRLRVKTDSKENLKNLWVKHPIFLSCLKSQGYEILYTGSQNMGA